MRFPASNLPCGVFIPNIREISNNIPLYSSDSFTSFPNDLNTGESVTLPTTIRFYVFCDPNGTQSTDCLLQAKYNILSIGQNIFQSN